MSLGMLRCFGVTSKHSALNSIKCSFPSNIALVLDGLAWDEVFSQRDMKEYVDMLGTGPGFVGV